MAGVRFDQNQIRPGVDRCRASATLVRVMESVEEGDILVATGFHELSGTIEVHLATATTISRSRGMFFVADYSVSIVSEPRITAVALEWKMITATSFTTKVLDTSGAAVGDAVYLSRTVAGKLFAVGTYPTATASGAAHAAILVVGRVLKSHATEGVIMLAPATMARGSKIVGKVTLSGGTSSTVTGLTTELDGAAVVLTVDASGALSTSPTALINNGTLTIHHVASSDDATYIITA